MPVATRDTSTPPHNYMLASHNFPARLSGAQVDKLARWARKSVFHAGARLVEERGRAARFWIAGR
jgi:hypothetical protein